MSLQATIRALNANGTRVGRLRHELHVLRLSYDDRIIDKLRNMATTIGLRVDGIAVHKGFFRHTVKIELFGQSNLLARYARELDDFVERNA